MTAATPASKKNRRRMAPGSIKLQLAGELIMVKSRDTGAGGLFQRYTELFEALANMPKEERLTTYRFLTGLMLTSHARKTEDKDTKKKLFDFKNEIFLQLASDRQLRKKLKFSYLVSRYPRVVNYCSSCQKKNTAGGLPSHKWEHCKNCELDLNFFNLLSMEHRFPSGHMRLFISHEHMGKIPDLRQLPKMKLGEVKEEAIFQKYHYNATNLDTIELDSVLKLHDKLKR